MFKDEVDLRVPRLKPESVERKGRARNFLHAEDSHVEIAAPIQVLYDQGDMIDILDLRK